MTETKTDFYEFLARILAETRAPLVWDASIFPPVGGSSSARPPSRAKAILSKIPPLHIREMLGRLDKIGGESNRGRHYVCAERPEGSSEIVVRRGGDVLLRVESDPLASPEEKMELRHRLGASVDSDDPLGSERVERVRALLLTEARRSAESAESQ